MTDQPPSVADSKFYEKVWVLGLSLLCCWPAGLVFVWMSKNLSQRTKIAITGVMAGLIAVGLIVGAVAPKKDVATPAETTTTTTKAAQANETTTTVAETTTTTMVETTTTASPTTEAPFKSVTLEGTGDDIKSELAQIDEPVILKIEHQGAANFIVQSDSDLMVNTIGKYSGRLLLPKGSTLEIKADGKWMITTQPISAATPASQGASGKGDDVLAFDADRKPFSVTHSGASNFMVGGGAVGLLAVNEIGNYSGKVFIAGPLVEVKADGAWTFTPG